MLSEMKLDSLGRLVAFQVVVQDLQVVVQDLQVVDQTMGMML
jgi:DNA-binding cell septation regulator SpoVG